MTGDQLVPYPGGIAIGATLLMALLLASVIDMRRMILPDWITLPLIPAGLLLAQWQVPSLPDRVIGAVLGYGCLAGISALYRRLRHRDGLGLGDAKLFAAAGAWVGWIGLPSVLLIAAASGLLWALLKRQALDRPFPFGPFLAIGFWLVWRFGPLGIDWN